MAWTDISQSVLEPTLDSADADPPQLGPFQGTAEDLSADCGQDGIGENRTEHPGTALHLAATFGDECDHRIVVGEGNSMVLFDALGEASEPQVDDGDEQLVVQRVIREWRLGAPARPQERS